MSQFEIVVTTPDGAMPTTVVHPDGPPAPGVIMYMPAPGVIPNLLDFAQRLCDEGYFVAVPHLYYRFGENLTFDPRGAGPEVFSAMRETMLRLSDDMVVSDTAALLTRLDEESALAPGPRGAVGFCMGARHVLRVMAALPDRFVAGSGLHPAFIVTDAPDSPHLGLETITGEIYMGFGGADALTPVAVIPTFEEQVHGHGIAYSADVHPGAEHGFMMPGRAFAPEAAELSWRRTIELFGRTLSPEAVSA